MSCSLYADDTAIFVQNQHQLAGIISNIDIVGTYTGLTLNLSKTIALDPFAKIRQNVAGVEINSSPVKYLGVILGCGNLTENNFAIPCILPGIMLKNGIRGS